MEVVLGTTIGVYIGVVVVIMGFCAFMTGQAISNNWKPLWQLTVYLVLLSFVCRFMVFALYQGELLLFSGWLVDLVVMLGMGYFAYFVTRSRKMVSQYPWLYERVGMFGWRHRHE